MNRIHGKILTRSQNLPVPNLLVVAFDVDQAARPRINTNLSSHNFANNAGALWDSIQQDRLGSTLTDESGEFLLEFEDDLFRRDQETEARPDLLVIVLAPEDAQVSQPTTFHPAERILAVSSTIRAGAGRTEAYVLRIPEERMEAMRLSAAPSFAADDLDATQVMASITRRTQFEKRLLEDESFQAALAPVREAVKKESEDARAFVARIANSPRVEDVLRVAKPSQRFEVMTNAMDVGLAAVTRQIPEFRRPISDRQAERLEAGEPAEDVLNDPTGGSLDRVRTRTLLEACQAREACKRLREGGVPPSPSPTPSNGTPTGPSNGDLTTVQAHDEVRRRVVGQVASLHSFVPGDLDRRQDPLGLRESLDSLELRGGPADAVAYHDFHTLQIAFKSVWEEAYDDVVGSDAAGLYEDWVRVRRYLGQPAPRAADLAEFESLTDFLGAVRRDLSTAGALSERTGSDATWEGNAGPPGIIGQAVNTVGQAIDAGTQAFGGDGGGGAGRRRRRSATGARVTVRGRSDRTATARRGRVATTAGRGTGARRAPSTDENLLARLGRMLEGVEARLREPYRFDVFAPETFNFGLMVTYRQRWEPESYQVGELVSTIPLAPGEKRTISVKQTVKKSRSQKEAENALSSLKSEGSQTSRADAEIVKKASTSTNFKQTANAEFSLGDFLEVGGTSEFTTEQGRESEQTKKAFRESVRKAAEEYKKERKLEVTTTEESTLEETRTGELSNPNTEITVTYLFYELQRRYLVQEQLHRVRPVIMVARDVPKPSDIDEDWLLAHEWICRRVLLDDSLAPAFDYIKSSVAGDEFAVEVLKTTWARNLQVVGQIMAHLESRSALRDEMRTKVSDLLRNVENDETGQDVAAAIFSGGLSLLFGGAGEASTLEAHREAADRELEFTESEFQEAEARLRQATNALETSTEKYVAAMRTQLNRRVMVDQLRIHVKENILHYMQAIWSHEPPDQRYFHLYRLRVPWFELETGVNATVVARRPGEGQPTTSQLTRLLLSGAITFGKVASVTPRVRRREGVRRLVEVAELDTLLGFKGNYMIFPLKESNPLVDFMMESYEVDDALGVIDPDSHGNYTTEELEELIRCVDGDSEITDEEREGLKELLCQRLASARKDVERIIVPTGQLFIESLPGKHPVLEDFKLVHRAVDMKKAEAEWRGLELENLRRADRLIAGEREDPDIDRHILVEGADDVLVGDA